MSEPQLGEMEAELAKFNKPYTYQPFPCWLTKATRLEGGTLHFEQLIVQNKAEQDRWAAEGFVRGGEEGAKAALNRVDEGIAAAAAEAMAKAQKMGRTARREFEERERTADDHVTE